MPKTRLPQPPEHLEPDTAAWWASVVARYVLQEHHLRLLTAAAECWDRAQQARAVLETQGLTFDDRFGSPHPRPEVKIENTAKVTFARLLRELCLDLEPPSETRPPRRGGIGG